MWVLILEIIIGVVAYFIMKGQLVKIYSADFVKSVKWMLIVPIVQVLVFAPIGYLATQASEVVETVDKLSRISTYAPFFGEDVNYLVNLGIEYDLINDTAMQNSHMGDLVISAGITQIVGFIGVILFLIMAFTQFRGIFGTVKEKRIKMANTIAAMTILVVGLSFAWVMTCTSKAINSSDDYFGFICMFVLACILIPFSMKFHHAVSLYYSEKNDKIVVPTTQRQSNNNGSSKVEQLRELKKLLDEGFLTKEEFDNEKGKILNQ